VRETRPIATTPTTRATQPSGENVSPERRPALIGTIVETIATMGASVVIGPRAYAEYSSQMPRQEVTPVTAPATVVSGCQTPPSSGAASVRATTPASAASAVTSIAMMRLAASPPRKSAAP
jgi:hypothetical protein